MHSLHFRLGRVAIVILMLLPSIRLPRPPSRMMQVARMKDPLGLWPAVLIPLAEHAAVATDLDHFHQLLASESGNAIAGLEVLLDGLNGEVHREGMYRTVFELSRNSCRFDLRLGRTSGRIGGQAVIYV